MRYVGNIEALMRSDLLIYQPRDNRKRIAKEVAHYRKNNMMPTVDLLMKKYSLPEGEAKKLLASIKRKITRDENKKKLKGKKKANNLHKSRIIPKTTERIQVLKKTAIEETGRDTSRLQEILHDIRAKYGDEIRIHGEQTSIPEGFIYLVTHCLFDSWVKAGMTIDFEQRLMNYNISDPLSRFKFCAVKWVSNRRQAEADLLEHLASEATESNGEWFLIDHAAALTVFKKIRF